MKPVFRSKPEDAIVSSFGWGQLPNGKWVTRLPLVDRKHTPSFARLGYNDLIAVADRIGARLESKDSFLLRAKHGLRLVPYIMPTAAQRKAMPRAPGESVNAYEGRVRTDMASKDWCDEHDADQWRQLAEANYGSEPPEGTPVVLVAKVNLAGAPDNYHRMMGDLVIKNGKEHWMQPDQVNHKGRMQVDYNTLANLECDDPRALRENPMIGVIESVSPLIVRTGVLPPLHDTPIADAILAAARADLGVHEQGGKNRGPEVDAWLRAAGVQPPANWCSVSVMKWIRDAERASGARCAITGSPGARATMAQLQKVNRWYTGAEARLRFVPGCIVVWWRNRIDSWEGHIGIGESKESDTFTTIEGNSGPAGDRVAVMVRRWSDPQLLGIGLP